VEKNTHTTGGKNERKKKKKKIKKKKILREIPLQDEHRVKAGKTPGDFTDDNTKEKDKGHEKVGKPKTLEH